MLQNTASTFSNILDFHIYFYEVIPQSVMETKYDASILVK